MIINEKYKVLEIVGRGGGGVVYKVEQLGCDRILAVKETLIRTGQKREWVEREKQILKECFHPALPVVLESFWQGDCHYMVMEYVEGVTLQEYVEQKGKLTKEQALSFAWEISEILLYLHSRSQPIVYGDLKPENLMVTEKGQIRLLDFGTAMREQEEKQEGCYASLGYASPEQQKGRTPGITSDIYSFGALLHYLLTGEDPCRPPYIRRTLRECDRSFSRGLEMLLSHCLKEEPTKRYQTMETVRQALRNYKKADKWAALFQNGRKMRYAYKMEKNVWKTQKQRVGFFAIFLVAGFLGFYLSAGAQETEKQLPVTVYDETGCKLCVEEGSLYDLKGAFRLEVPKECFTPGQVSEITVTLSTPSAQNAQIRTFRICPQINVKSSIEKSD